jgi:H2C2 zinc finger
LGFKRIGRVPACGNLKSFSEPVDAIIYGRDLKAEGENIGNEERFDKIRYYLRHSSYPQGADRSEKSRLRSAATHYKLIPAEDGAPEKLMLKDKEVISDPNAQYEIAKQIHLQSHGGINKTTAMIATKYHWVRIKETVSHVIKNCPECKDSSKAAAIRIDSNKPTRNNSTSQNPQAKPDPQTPTEDQHPLDDLPIHQDLQPNQIHGFTTPDHQFSLTGDPLHDHESGLVSYDEMADEMALDPQIIEQLQAQIANEEYQQHHQYVHSGLPDYGDPSDLQHPPHLTHPSDPHGFVNQPPEQYIHNPGQTMMHPDHMMDDGSGGTGLNNMQGMQHVLHMDYMNSDGSNYKQ